MKCNQTRFKLTQVGTIQCCSQNLIVTAERAAREKLVDTCEVTVFLSHTYG